VRIAAPVVERLGERAVRLGYLDLDGFIVVVSQDGPVLPNGVALTGTGVWDPTLTLSSPALEPTDDERPLEAIGAEMIGRGPGLTPEGDDFVAGLAGVLAAAGRHDDVAALIGTDLRRRTTALSATLIELAAQAMGPRPLQAVLAGSADALADLLALGHTSGRAYARGAAVGLWSIRYGR
jgi:Protein of unknown function (DUF2877)